MEYSDNLKERIVEQAFASAQFEMTEEQKRKLIQDKFERAAVLRNALIQSKAVEWHTDH